MSLSPPRPTRIFPIPYQVDFSEENKGRHLDSTKRKISWKFGFAHPPAVFPHLFDGDGNFVGSNGDDGMNYFNVDQENGDTQKTGVDCRGREHEIVLIWSLLTGKAHLYVNNQELFRHAPSDEIFNPFSAQFHKGFDLPHPKQNGYHRIDIRCYARTPLGAKNMAVDNMGGKFHQYDLSVDGLSYFSMPAMYELGTSSMWSKVEKWGLMRRDSIEKNQNYANTTGLLHSVETLEENGKLTGRLEDEYYFSKVNPSSRSLDDRYSRSMSKGEIKAMSPRTGSEEERMIRIATEASLKEWDNARRLPSDKSIQKVQPPSVRQAKSEINTTRLAPVGENESLIDFGDDDNGKQFEPAVSQISYSAQVNSDVSVLGEDDETTATFMRPQASWNNTAPAYHGLSPFGSVNQQPFVSSGGQYFHQQQQASVRPHFTDPTFNPYVSSTPRSDVASFAYAPPPTWDDYNNAFGGSFGMKSSSTVANGSTVMMNSMTGTYPPVNAGALVPVSQQQSQYSGYYAAMPSTTQWQTQSSGVQYQHTPLAESSPAPNQNFRNSIFDPLRSDPFAS